MSQVQRIIKYLAIAFAVFLIVSIISGILSAIFGISFIFNIGEEMTKPSEIGNLVAQNFEQTSIEALDIEIACANLVIKDGETISVSTNNPKVKASINSGKLKIQDETSHFFNNTGNYEVIVCIPRNIELKEIDLSAGAGNTTLEEINVFESASVECGAGNFEILSGNIKNLDLDLGVGNVNISATLLGRCDIDAGVGELNLNVKGNKEEYVIDVDKGLGSIKIDGEELTGNLHTKGTAYNTIDIDGGVGSISLNFN